MKNNNLKRGATIEIVVFVMMVIFLLSALLVSMSAIASKHKSMILNTLTERVEIDEVAEDYLADGTLSVGNTEKGYKVEESADKKTVTVKRDGKTVLTVVLDGDGKIESWEY